MSYYKELLKLYNSLFNERIKKKDAEKIWDSIDKLYLKYAKNEYVESIIDDAIVHYTKRTDAEFVNVPLPSIEEIPINKWSAIHDLMEYGDIEETYYRELFKAGCIRVELRLPDKNGEIKESGKVYYIPDPQPIKSPEVSESMKKQILADYTKDKEKIKDRLERLIAYSDVMNIQQSAWLEYNNMLGKTITY